MIALGQKQVRPVNHARGLAMLHAAMFEAVNAIERRYVPYKLNLTADRTTSKEAAAAAADHDVLLALYPDQQDSLDETLAAMLTGVDDGEPKANGIDLGKRLATAIIALRANDGIDAQEAYRPHTTPGISNDPTRVLHCWSPYSVGDEEWLAIPARCPAGPHLRDMDKRCQRDS